MSCASCAIKSKNQQIILCCTVFTHKKPGGACPRKQEVPSTETSMEQWWIQLFRGGKKKAQATHGVLVDIHCLDWNIWRERNRRIFEGKSALPSRVVAMIKQEVHLRHQACGGDELILVS